jgi:hypothetical protein
MRLNHSGALSLGKAMKRVSLRNWMLAATAASVMLPTLVLVADTAVAQSSGRGGASVKPISYCPPGTCNINGGQAAYNLRNCKASNCRK